MSQPFDPEQLSDDQLEELLGRALAADDPVPGAVVTGAIGAEAWRTIDAELAEIAFDSALSTSGARSHSGPRQLTFRVGGAEIEVLVSEGAEPRLEGQVIPASPGGVELSTIGGTSEAPVDELGRFRFAHVPRGPVRFALAAGGRRIKTTWVVLRPIS